MRREAGGGRDGGRAGGRAGSWDGSWDGGRAGGGHRRGPAEPVEQRGALELEVRELLVDLPEPGGVGADQGQTAVRAGGLVRR
jgi:hypothetical protein